ncbi:hypothetical protein, partial [Rouxiella sp. Mn2063]|uniref:hypothetical protein n=1 Tax=Rouxiella sp. Mn2063 TaxID=3395262 RepID=UPI003BEA8226
MRNGDIFTEPVRIPSEGRPKARYLRLSLYDLKSDVRKPASAFDLKKPARRTQNNAEREVRNGDIFTEPVR